MKGRGSALVSPSASWQVPSSTSKESSQGLDQRFEIRDALTVLLLLLVLLVGRARAATPKARNMMGKEICIFEVEWESE